MLSHRPFSAQVGGNIEEKREGAFEIISGLGDQNEAADKNLIGNSIGGKEVKSVVAYPGPLFDFWQFEKEELNKKKKKK